jgi:hypothetical protein
MKYRIVYSNDAENDIFDLDYIIREVYKSPLTAARYIQGIYDEIKKLEIHATIYAVQFRESLLRYGFNVRLVNYKKIAIIYTIHNDTVLIRRIIAENIIK